MNATEALLRELLRGGRESSTEVAPPTDIDRFIRLASLHRVSPLLDRRFEGLPNRDSWPGQIIAACHEEAVFEAAIEVVRHAEILRVLDAFALAGIEPLILKGAALAYSHYPQPWLRPRDDLDLLVPESSRDAASETLATLGYASAHGVTGTYLSPQATWSLRDSHGFQHDVDLHWQTSGLPVLARALAYEEMKARAVAISSLGPHALAPAPIHALLFAGMHRVAHRGDPAFAIDNATDGGNRLIWLYDMHLLLEHMVEGEVDEFVELASGKELTAICRDAFLALADLSENSKVQLLVERLQRTGSREPSEWLLSESPASRMMGDLGAIDSLAGRARWLRDRIFPSAGYMREYFAGTNVRWLPWMYVRRAANGIRKLLSPGGGNHAP